MVTDSFTNRTNVIDNTNYTNYGELHEFFANYTKYERHYPEKIIGETIAISIKVYHLESPLEFSTDFRQTTKNDRNYSKGRIV